MMIAIRAAARKAGVLVALPAGVLATVLEARAIEPLRTDPNLSVYHKAGPVYWQPTFSLRDVGYDDNVFLTSDSTPATTDYTFTIAPTVRVFAPAGDSAAIRARADLSYTSFSRNSDQSFFAGAGAVRGDYYLPHWNLYVDADYLTTRVRSTDEFHMRPRRIDRGLSLGARLVRAERLSLHLYALRDDVEFEAEEAGTTTFRARLNRAERAAGAALAYRVGRKTDLAFEAESRDYDFASDDSLTPRIQSHKVLAGLDWKPTARITTRLRAGIMRFEPEALREQSFDDLTWSASVTFPLFARLWANLNGGRDLWLSTYQDNLFALTTRGALNFTTLVTRKSGVEFGGMYYRARYSDEAATPEPRRDHVSRVYVGGRHRFSERASAALRVTQFVRNSNIDGQDARENLVSASLDWLF